MRGRPIGTGTVYYPGATKCSKGHDLDSGGAVLVAKGKDGHAWRCVTCKRDYEREYKRRMRRKA